MMTEDLEARRHAIREARGLPVPVDEWMRLPGTARREPTVLDFDCHRCRSKLGVDSIEKLDELANGVDVWLVGCHGREELVEVDSSFWEYFGADARCQSFTVFVRLHQRYMTGQKHRIGSMRPDRVRIASSETLDALAYAMSQAETRHGLGPAASEKSRARPKINRVFPGELPIDLADVYADEGLDGVIDRLGPGLRLRKRGRSQPRRWKFSEPSAWQKSLLRQEQDRREIESRPKPMDVGRWRLPPMPESAQLDPVEQREFLNDWHLRAPFNHEREVTVTVTSVRTGPVLLLSNRALRLARNPQLFVWGFENIGEQLRPGDMLVMQMKDDRGHTAQTWVEIT